MSWGVQAAVLDPWMFLTLSVLKSFKSPCHLVFQSFPFLHPAHAPTRPLRLSRTNRLRADQTESEYPNGLQPQGAFQVWEEADPPNTDGLLTSQSLPNIACLLVTKRNERCVILFVGHSSHGKINMAVSDGPEHILCVSLCGRSVAQIRSDLSWFRLAIHSSAQNFYLSHNIVMKWRNSQCHVSLRSILSNDQCWYYSEFCHKPDGAVGKIVDHLCARKGYGFYCLRIWWLKSVQSLYIYIYIYIGDLSYFLLTVFTVPHIISVSTHKKVIWYRSSQCQERVASYSQFTNASATLTLIFVDDQVAQSVSCLTVCDVCVQSAWLSLCDGSRVQSSSEPR